MSDDQENTVSQVLGRVEPRLGRAEERLGDGVESVRAMGLRVTRTEENQVLLEARQQLLDARLARIEQQLEIHTPPGDGD
jgi:hypothetical protein